MRNAEDFGQPLQLRQPAVTVRLVPGGGHTMRTWPAVAAAASVRAHPHGQLTEAVTGQLGQPARPPRYRQQQGQART